jgi:ATP-binding cassette, subfamily B, bacterial
LQNAYRDAVGRPYSLAAAALMLVRSLITLVSLGALLWHLAWWSVLLLALSAIPEFFFETKVSGDAYRLASARAQDQRKRTYLESLLTRDAHVKEVKLFDLGPLVMQRYHALFTRFFREDQRLGRRRMLLGTVFAGLSSLSFYACYVSVGYRAAMGLLGVGDLTLAIAAFRQGQGALEDVLSSFSGIFDDARYVSNVSAFLSLPPTAALTSTGHRTLPPGRFTIEVDRLSFRYPGREEWALREVSFTLQPGEKLALVGENGAGKSTLIKLLLRLYEPTEGTIRFGGVARGWARCCKTSCGTR